MYASVKKEENWRLSSIFKTPFPMQTRHTLSKVSLSFSNTMSFSTSYVLKLSLSSALWDSLYIRILFTFLLIQNLSIIPFHNLQVEIKADNELNDINHIVNQSFQISTSERWSFERRSNFHFTFTIELYLSELRLLKWNFN